MSTEVRYYVGSDGQRHNHQAQAGESPHLIEPGRIIAGAPELGLTRAWRKGSQSETPAGA